MAASRRKAPRRGEPGLNYSLNHDEGSLIITRSGPAGDKTVTAAHLGQDGVFRDETGAPIARAAGSSVVIDPDAVSAAAAPKETQQDDAGANVSAETQTQTKREEPKLCPDPGPENINGRKKFDVQYEQYVRSIVNPQRQPPLPAGLAFSLTASKLFEDDDKLNRIKIFVRPYPGGVPKHNPRINSLDEYEDFE
ncbi:MAG: hypothetical protein ABSD11_03845 [Methylocella sp.]|jgi:hypothetical protein